MALQSAVAVELPALEGAANFRELGGLRTADGRSVRRRLLYRCEALNLLGARDLDVVRSLGIELICDLRSPRERSKAPTRWPADCSPALLVAVGPGDGGAADIRHALERSPDETEAQARAYMIETYRGFPAAFADTLRALFDHLIEGSGPVLIHCAAGKDRTGFICALILHALGVPYEAIEADYLHSDLHFGRARIAAILHPALDRVPPGVDAFRVRAEYLRDLLAFVEREHRSVDAYLERRTGLTAPRRERLREALLEAAP